jgi:rare lipoprotein A (peptidoglycan hydrolase)
LILSLTLATLAFVSASTARPTTQPTRLAPEAFAPVVIPSAAPSAGGRDAGAVRPLTPALSAPPDPIVDFSTPQRSLDPRPNPDTAAQAGIEVKPTPTPTPRPTPTPKPTVRTPRPAAPVSQLVRRAPRTAPAPRRTGHSVSGPASWYCKTGTSACTHGYPGGMYAAAGPALRVGAWRGRVVQVCGAGGCISVRLIDWCGCPNGRVMDLYSDAYRRLSPLSTGTQRVRVSW